MYKLICDKMDIDYNNDVIWVSIFVINEIYIYIISNLGY